ncbi:MAG: ATP synthase F0 subunit B [Desulfovibrio sp.]|nr:ATP synthase F0 subunit B [Desulfovibrio sp.]
MLDLNITLLFQLGNFFLALLLLNILLIRPVREVLKKRKELVNGLTDEAESFESKAEKSLADYDAALLKARQDANALRQESREEGVSEQQTLVHNAQTEAHNLLDQARKSLQKEADATLAALRAEVGTLSQSIADRLIKG